MLSRQQAQNAPKLRESSCFDAACILRTYVSRSSNVRLTFASPFLVWTWQAKEAYLQRQIGNPDGEEKPNKKFYDPRVWIRKASKHRLAFG